MPRSQGSGWTRFVIAVSEYSASTPRACALHYSPVADFAILNSRKRALIALLHTVVFLTIALLGFTSRKPAASLHGPGRKVAIFTLVLYGVVVSILTLLAWFARCAKERIYFALCAAGASFGFVRTLLGDPAIPAAQYLRVLMLACAVAVGIWIFRGHAEDPLLD